jgi:hypothetical protein
MAVYGPLENSIFDVFKKASHYGSLTHQHHVHITETEGGVLVKQAVSYRGKTAMSEQSHFIRTASWTTTLIFSGVPRNFFRGGSTDSVEDRGQRERGSGGGSPIVRGFGGCNLVQVISFHIVKFS